MSMRVYTKVIWQWEGDQLVEKEAYFYDYDGPVALAKTNPNLVQSRFRFRSGADTGTPDATPTWIAGENACVAIDVSGGNTKFRLRMGVQETAGGADTATSYALRTSLDSFAAAITTTNTGCRSADASTSADETAIAVQRLSGTGTFVNGVYDETGTCSTTVTIGASGNSEFEFGLELVAADLTDGQVIEFRIYHGTSVMNAIQKVCFVTVVKNSNFGGLKGYAIGSQTTGTSIPTNAAVVAASGDLVFASVGANGSPNIPNGLSDNLTNTWHAFTAGTNSINSNLRCWYTIVTNAGEMTVTGTIPTTNDCNIVAAVFRGPFAASPLDANPADVVDTTNPMTGPSSGTLSQAIELALTALNNRAAGTITAVPSGFTFPYQGFNAASLTLLGIAYQVTASTASVGGDWTVSTAGTCVMSLATFKNQAAAFVDTTRRPVRNLYLAR